MLGLHLVTLYGHFTNEYWARQIELVTLNIILVYYLPTHPPTYLPTRSLGLEGGTKRVRCPTLGFQNSIHRHSHRHRRSGSFLSRLPTAMTIDGEPAKVLLPFLQRADELQKHDHLVAYYCKFSLYSLPLNQARSVTVRILIRLFITSERIIVFVWMSNFGGALPYSFTEGLDFKRKLSCDLIRV